MNYRHVALTLLVAASALASVAGLGTLLPTGTHPAPSSELAPSQSHGATGSAAALPPPATPRSAALGGLLSVPGASTPTSMTYDSAAGYLFLVTPTRGTSGSSTLGSWAFQSGGWTQLFTVLAPPSREYASLAFDGQSGQVLLFGGYSPSGTFLSDTWGFSSGHWTNLTGSSSVTPPARADAGLAYDAAGNFTLMYGGYGATGPLSTGTLSDTWEYSSGNWTQVSTTVTPPPSGAMAYDANLSSVVYYGGVGLLGICTASTYEFRGGAWTDVSSSISGSPGPIALESMTYDPQYGGVVAYGGVCGLGIAGVSLTLSSSNSTWALSAGSWARVAARSAPAPSYGGDLAYDPSSAGLLLFGGVEPTLIGVGKVTQQLSGGTFLCAQYAWARLGPNLTSSASLAETGMNVTLHVANAVVSGNATYSYSGFPGVCANASGPTVQCRASQTGNFTMRMNATLLLGLSGSGLAVANVTASVAIQVVPGLVMAPLSASLPVGEVGVPMTLSASVSDGVRVSAYQYGGLPGGCASVSAPSLSCTPSTSGAFTVSLTALDILGVRDTETVPVQVAARASVESFSLSRAVVDLGMETNASAVLLGGVGPFAVVFGTLPQGCLTVDSLTLTCRPSATGTFGFDLQVRDALNVRAVSNTTLRVNPFPTVRSAGLSNTTVKVGARTTFELTLAGGTQPFVVTYSGLPSGCATANTTQLLCTPRVSGNFTITVTATDAVGARVVTTAHLTVESQSPVTRPVGGGSSGIPPFAEGLATGSALFAGIVSALLVRGRARTRESRRLAAELLGGVETQGEGLAEEAERIGPGAG
ncbi:MAG: kelch motif-containing protein [Thermoplasmata archaeon]|nr:kelch motif-containing protein [Thermoplasmata archaeon]MCI4360014.1 kelch motif-containing protein [Thermoplasmata archaeon]